MTEMCLVLGASGNLGIRVTARLITAGKRVRGLVRSPHKVAAVKQVGAVTGLFDLEDPTTLIPHLDGVTYIINTSYISFAPNILKAVRDHGKFQDRLERLVFVGSTGVHSRLKSESAESKRVGEQSIVESGFPFTILRPTMIYGHRRDRNICRLLQCFKKYPVFPVFGDGLSTMQPVYIGDVVEAVVSVLERPETRGKIYDIGGPNPVTYCDLLVKAAAAMGKRIRFIRVSLPLAVTLARVLSTLRVSPLSGEQVLRLTENKHVDISRAKMDFGYEPISLEEGLRLELWDMQREAGMLAAHRGREKHSLIE